MEIIEKIKKEIVGIHERNKRVEMDKAWETSWTRKILIIILTYVVIVVFFIFAGLSKPFVNSIVPSLAFVLSTLSLPMFKRMWINRVMKK